MSKELPGKPTERVWQTDEETIAALKKKKESGGFSEADEERLYLLEQRVREKDKAVNS